MPNTAASVPSGNGGTSEAPLTKCCAGTGIVSSRPGRAVSGVGISDLCLENMRCTSLAVADSDVGRLRRTTRTTVEPFPIAWPLHGSPVDRAERVGWKPPTVEPDPGNAGAGRRAAGLPRQRGEERDRMVLGRLQVIVNVAPGSDPAAAVDLAATVAAAGAPMIQ